MVGVRREWLSVQEAAYELGLPQEVVLKAAAQGEIPAITVGGNVRINLNAALTNPQDQPIVETAPEKSTGSWSKSSTPSASTGIPAPADLQWVESLTPGEDYRHRWPKRTTDSKDNFELYKRVVNGTIRILGEQLAVKVGIATRYRRGRMTVFFNKVPICEFVETADGHGFASLVKPDGKRVLRANETPPALYRGTRLESYREATNYTEWTVSGVGVPKGLAAVIDREDYTSAVHHAGARWLGRRGHTAVPQT